MTAKTHIILEEERNLLNLNSRRRCFKYSFPKLILLIVCACLALIFTLIYYGVYLGTEGTFHDILQSDSIQAAFIRGYSNELTSKQIFENLAESSKLDRRKRDLVEIDALDPMQSNFNELRAKIRDKRAKIELSKLEQDYVKCKRESVNQSDCMETFMKMYKLAMEISDKMEKMKAIFRDSDLLQTDSFSSSMEKYSEIDGEKTTTLDTDNEDWDGEVTSSPDGMDNTMDPDIKKLIDGHKIEDNATKYFTTILPSTTDASTEKSDLSPEQHPHPSSTEGYDNEKLRPDVSTTPSRDQFTLNATTDGIQTSLDDLWESFVTPVQKDASTKPDNVTEQKFSIDSTTPSIEAKSDGIWEVPEPFVTPVPDSTSTKDHSKAENTTKLVDAEDLVTPNLVMTTKATDIDVSTFQTPEKSTERHPTDSGSLNVSTSETTKISEPTAPVDLDPVTQSFKTTNESVQSLDDATDGTSTSLPPTTESFHTASVDVRKLDEIPAFPSTTEVQPTTKGADLNSQTKLIVNTTQTDVEVFTPSTFSTKAELTEFDTESWTEDSTTTTLPIAFSTDSNPGSSTEPPKQEERSFDSKGFQAVITNRSANIDITYRGKCGLTNYKYKTPTDARSVKDCSFLVQKKKKDDPRASEDHPLDNPSSRENMLDDEAFDQIDNPIKSQEEWKKTFEEGAAVHDEDLMNSHEGTDHTSLNKFGPKINPNDSPSRGKNPQLMTLCEQLMNQMRSKVTSAPEKNPDTTPSTSVQFTSRGPGFPVTGETMKASAQFLFNPNFGVPSIPVCFYITPASFRMMMQPFWSPFFGMQGMGGGNGGNSGASGGGVFIVPPTFGNVQSNGNFFGHSSPTGSGSQGNIPNIFSKSASSQQMQQQDQKQQQFFCTYMQNGAKQSMGNGFSNINFKLRDSSGNESSPTDIIYSSYWNSLPSAFRSHAPKDRFQCPLAEDVPCYGGNECVPESKWCDSTVDCSDGSDEAACTCRQRLQEHRICDGYQDCPLGEDEIGCFGCNKFMYSCYDNMEEFERANRSTLSMCYSTTERCDGEKNCINGRDESGCNLIVEDLTHHMSHVVSGSVGYLYRNHRGVWYPVCNNAQKWAREACREELGDLSTDPIVTFQEVELPGPFIEPHYMGEVHFPQSCQKRERDVLRDHAAHVRCPPPQCGKIQESASPLLRSRRRRSRRAIDEKDGRIVGGSFSKPLQWPFVVALYRNGEFHCGGTIFNEKWIITAAHCTIGFQKYFYEVRAGMLRRSSFSSSLQIHQVSHVVVHQQYERRSMKNDFALLRLETPLRYNRWVKPICLPDKGRTTNGDDWIWGPEVDTVCTVVGWGAIREKGPGSDRLREVNLPIRKRCTDKDDQEAEDICAGEAVGGRDACQGDSGGPMFCRSVSNSKEWYLAGVVSHGNGCARAREFGVYTRVALFLDWIEMALKPEYLPKVQPKQICPGHMCIWGGKHCVSQAKRCDRLVDCLGGEDEVGCIYNFIPDVGAALNASTTVSMDIASGSTDGEEEATATVSGFTAKISPQGSDGGDTDPSSLENGDNNPSSTVYVDTTEATTESSPHPGLKSLLDWMSADDETSPIPIASEITSTLTEETTEQPSTRVASSTVETSNLKDLAVKFLEALDKTTESSALITTMSSDTSDSTQTSEVPSTSEFGEFKAVLPESSSGAPTSVHKRENATQDGTTTVMPKTMPKKISQKFVCKKIPQIIDINNRCDRISDCEDGTDEDDCTCRQYLKGPLSILICDGKTDCEDLTDEDDCGKCTSTEFLCPMSRTCIDSKKRCDNIVDCQFKEDEKDCFALAKDDEFYLDTTKDPIFKSAGLFAHNTHGVWRVVCLHETDFHSNGANTAEGVCSLLGFTGAIFYKTVKFVDRPYVPIEPDFEEKAFQRHRTPVGDGVHFTDHLKHVAHTAADIEASPRSNPNQKVEENCLGLFVECVAKSNGSAPLKLITAGEVISPKTFGIHGLKPNGTPSFADAFGNHKVEILDKLNKLIETKKTVLVHDKLHEGLERWHWSWLVDVYNNGKLWCIGVLVDKHWVLVHESCYIGVRLDTDYVTVLLGGGKNKNIHHKTPHEQIKRVDCFEAVKSSDILLLHLEYAAHFTRHVLPTFLPDTSLTEQEDGKTLERLKQECMSVVHDKFGGIKVTPTVGKLSDVKIGEQPSNNASDTICDSSGDNKLACYQWDPKGIADFKVRHLGEEHLPSVVPVEQEEDVKSLLDFCKDLDSSTSYPHNQGVIACREDNSGWYPMAFYTYNATECKNFKQPFPVRTLEKYYGLIQDIIDQPHCGNGYARPHCPTLRCPLGNCLLPEQLCNGKVDCHDARDEEKEFCRLHRNECKATELKCRSNGKCVPKKKFCDQIADCEDLTDEPTICSCFTYLQATDPGKICDGIRNCWDKSDESPVLCNCTSDRFPCGSSPSECIPKDFVCDKQPDCPNGEDEQFCYGIEQPISVHGSQRPSPYGQVIEQSYGIWHTKCFPRHRPPTSVEVGEICRKLGYHGSKPPSYRLIDDSDDIVAAAEVHGGGSGKTPGKYRDATKAVVINKFSPLHLNDDLTLILKPSRPIAELVKWNQTDSSNCYRLEVRCA